MRGRPKGRSDTHQRLRSSAPSRSASYTVRKFFKLLSLMAPIQDVAVHLDRSRASLSNYKTGKNTPSILTMEEMANAIGYELKLVRKEAHDAEAA